MITAVWWGAICDAAQGEPSTLIDCIGNGTGNRELRTIKRWVGHIA